MNKSIMLVGVGGQGTILTSKILAEGLLGAGYDVKMSEIHGMAQRGGSVTTHIKYGEKVNSPIISKGEADVLIAFEKVEALRYLCHLKAGGILIVSDHEIYSQSVLSGTEDYPQEIIESLTQAVERTIVLQAVKLAEQLGNIRTHNIVLLGVLVKALGLEQLDWVQVMKELIPEKVLEANVKAFKTGLTV